MLDSAERQSLLAFAQGKGITELYIAVAGEYEGGEGFAALADLVQRAGRAHIRLFWVAGDPSWALSEHHASALAVVDWAVRVNALLFGRRRCRRFVPCNTTSSRTCCQGGLRRRSRPSTRRSSRVQAQPGTPASSCGSTFRFGSNSGTFRATSLGRMAVRSSDGIVVMAYRSSAADVAGKAMSFLAATPTQKHARSWSRSRRVVARTPATTFCGASAVKLDPGSTASTIVSCRSMRFGGLAVHPYGRMQ